VQEKNGFFTSKIRLFARVQPATFWKQIAFSLPPGFHTIQLNVRELIRNPRLTAFICLVIGLVTCGLYLPAVTHEFLDYDDQQYVTENPHVRAGLTPGGLAWAFGNHVSNWHPLTWISHMADCQLYDLKSGGHHFTSIFLHAGTSVILFLALARMTRSPRRSAVVAALFAWHPLHVESVAWVAERKDVLSAFFWALTMFSYAKYAECSQIERVASAEQPRTNDRNVQPNEAASRVTFYLLSLSLFAFGLMSKPMVVTLPFVLLLLDFWPLQRLGLNLLDFRIGVLLEKIPFFALSAISCVLTIAAQSQAWSIVSKASLPISQRIAHATVAYAHYLGATVLPINLAVFYPYETTVPATQLVLSALVLLLLTGFSVWFARSKPYLVVGWLWFLGTLVPVIGLVQVGDQAWADRYTYIPLIGLFIAGVWAVSDTIRKGAEKPVLGTASASNTGKSESHWPRGLPAVGAVISVAMLVITFRQLQVWKDTKTLFEHAERVTQKNYMAISVLGSLMAREGRLIEAMQNYRAALTLKPGYAEAHFLLGNALDQQGNLNEAIAEYSQALRFKPTQEQTHILMAIALTKLKKYDEASAHYLSALTLNPESATAHNNYARLLHAQGKLEDAIAHYSVAIKLAPDLAQAHNNLGILLLQKNRVAEGVKELREAVRLNPDDAESNYNLALALNQQGNWAEAAPLFARTVSKAMTDPKAHYQFGVALAHIQKTREAMSQFASALLLQPDFPDALDGLAWILATSPNPEFRNAAEAVHMAELASDLSGHKQPDKLKTLSAALAEAGRFKEASDTALKAQSLAEGMHQGDTAKECRLMFESFAASKPWRQTN
jgi:tetratricopeptide (TPR) repeat protein